MAGTVEHAIVAVERSERAAWVAMRDVKQHLVTDDERLTREQSRRVLTRRRALHATFRGDVPDGAASLRDRLGIASPAVADAERPSPDLLPKQFEHGWEAFAEIVPTTTSPRSCSRCVGEPEPLADALLARTARDAHPR